MKSNVLNSTNHESTYTRRSLARSMGLAAGAAALVTATGGAASLAHANDADAQADGLAQLAADIQLLQDRAEITECQYRYARGADMQDADLLASAFDEIISVSYPDSDTVMEDVPGPDMAAGIVGNFVENGVTTQHFMNVYQIEIDGDEASALTYLRATHKMEGADFFIVGGYYENTYRRTEQGWRIKTVSLTYTYTEGEDYFA